MNTPDLRRLRDHFTPADIEWKPITISKKTNKGLAAAYINNRAIMERLDEVVGPENWRNDFRPGPGGGVVCGLSIRVVREDGTSEWIAKWDGADNTDIEAVKGGLSNAMRRAAVQWGIGRYLYDVPSQWVPVDDYGKFVQEPRLPREFLPTERTVERPQGARPASQPERAASPRRDDVPPMGDGFDRPARPATR